MCIDYPFLDTDLVYVHGYGASGKSTLMRLLDGHPELAVVPFHDKLLHGYPQYDLKKFDKDNVTNELFDVEKFQRKVLSKSHYHRLQAFHHGKPLKIAQTNEGIDESSMNDFSFYDFEEEWVNIQNELSPEESIYNIHHHFFKHWDGYEYNPIQTQYFVGMGVGRSRQNSMEYMLSNYADSKAIFVRRDPRGCIGALGSRDTTEENAFEFIKEGKLNEAIEEYNMTKKLKNRHPNRVLIIEFEDLILDSNRTMDVVSKFLNIKIQDVLKRPTFAGEILNEYENSYIGQIKDDWESLLTEKEKLLASIYIGENNILNVPKTTSLEYITIEARRKTKQTLIDLGKEVLQ